MKKNNEKSERIRVLLRKYKGLMKSHYKTVQFKEPIVFLIRRNKKVEFFDNALTGRFAFTHSDGDDRFILLEKNMLEFDYGAKKFRGYICHEDSPIPLPDTPLITSVMIVTGKPAS